MVLKYKINVNGQDPKRHYQCSLCQFRSNHPKFIEQHISVNHPNKSYAKMIINKKPQQPTPSQIIKPNSLIQTNGHIIKSKSYKWT